MLRWEHAALAERRGFAVPSVWKRPESPPPAVLTSLGDETFLSDPVFKEKSGIDLREYKRRECRSHFSEWLPASQHQSRVLPTGLASPLPVVL